LFPFQDISIDQVLTGWTFADNDLVVKIERNYNRKEAKIGLESTTKNVTTPAFM
jgi:hypothetical protein